MNKIIQIKSDKPSTHLRIEYMVGNTCNYQCRYCSDYANGGQYRWHPDTDFLLDNFRHLFDFYIKHGKKSFEISYVGGEPTLWPDIEKFTKTIKGEYNCRVVLTTNGSRTLRWWDENATLFDKIQFSLHVGQADIEHYINVCDLCFEKGVNLNSLVMMDPPIWDQCVDAIERCKKSKHPWFLNAMEVYSSYQYSQEQKEYISNVVKRRPSILWILAHEKIANNKPTVTFENGVNKKVNRNWISLNGLNHFWGWTCNLGVDGINIQRDGKISGVCNMPLYGEQSFYNIYDTRFKEKFNPTLTPVICAVDNCYCQPEQLLNKFR